MTTRRVVLGALLALAMSPGSLRAQAQDRRQIRRLAYLASVSAGADAPRLQAFRRALIGLGYVEGQNIVVEYRHEGGDLGRLPEIAAELIRRDPEVIVTMATPATLAARNATRTIPIVFAGVGDPVSFGFVDSLRRPGGNITGIANIVSVLAGKRLELLKQVAPRQSQVAVLWEAHTPASAQQWKESQLPARDLGLELLSMQIAGADQYERAFAEASKARATALAVTLSPTAATNQTRIVALANKYRLPAVYPRADFTDTGGLMSYGSSAVAEGVAAARYVDRILKGAKPADLPVEQPMEFELVINLKTARAIGLTIPQSVLLRADRVIE